MKGPQKQFWAGRPRSQSQLKYPAKKYKKNTRHFIRSLQLLIKSFANNRRSMFAKSNSTREKHLKHLIASSNYQFSLAD